MVGATESFLVSVIFLFLMAVPSLAVDHRLYPDPALTPGATNPVLTKEVICSPGFRTGKYRHVTISEKKKVFEEYGIPWSDRKDYETDHFISLEIGGSNDIKNLWPESYPEAKQKDVVENFLNKQVCQGKLTLEEAQQKIIKDWISAGFSGQR